MILKINKFWAGVVGFAIGAAASPLPFFEGRQQNIFLTVDKPSMDPMRDQRTEIPKSKNPSDIHINPVTLITQFKLKKTPSKRDRMEFITRLALMHNGLPELLIDQQAMNTLDATDLRRVMRLGGYNLENFVIEDINKIRKVETMLFHELAELNPEKAALQVIRDSTSSINPAFVQELAYTYSLNHKDFVEVLNQLPEKVRFDATFSSIPAFLATADTDVIFDVLNQLKNKNDQAAKIVRKCIELQPFYGIENSVLIEMANQIMDQKTKDILVTEISKN